MKAVVLLIQVGWFCFVSSCSVRPASLQLRGPEGWCVHLESYGSGYCKTDVLKCLLAEEARSNTPTAVMSCFLSSMT